MIRSILARISNYGFALLILYTLISGGVLQVWADKSGIGIQISGPSGWGYFIDLDTTENDF